MKRVSLVITSECEDIKSFTDRPIFKSLKKLDKIYNLSEFIYNILLLNKKGLSKVYNSFLKNPLYENDILVFVHDDLEIQDLFLIEKLRESPYIVTGLAGCTAVDLSKPPAWHLMSPRESWVGEVCHSTQDKEWTSVFGPTKSRALLLDGLFLAINVKEYLNYNVFFDEDFDFHHYDLSFCLRCNEAKIKVGVLPIKVKHYGLGDSINSEEWKKSSIIFKEKYCKG